jgi:hypothetical protein
MEEDLEGLLLLAGTDTGALVCVLCNAKLDKVL